MGRNAPSNSDDVIDSRDIIRRIEDLESDRDTYEIDCSTCKEDEDGDRPSSCDACAGTGKVSDTDESRAEWKIENPDDAEELRVLKELADQGEGYGDWNHGETLIRDSYFETYAQQFAEDIGALEGCDKWPATCIDWERAARELQQDYTSIEYDGETYWMRS